MSWKIGMPNLGHTMEEGTVSQWMKAIGDTVAKGEVIAVVESDKASFDIESPAVGILLAITAEAGAVVPVGETIGLVGAPGETLQQTPKSHNNTSATGVYSHPSAIKTEATMPDRPQRSKISPAARALAEELGLELDGLVAADGEMITRDDVRAHAAAKIEKIPTPSKALSPMRRAIAEATEKSWQTIPHVPLQSHADVTLLLGQHGVSLTAAIAKACALALSQHPAFNGWLIDRAFVAAAQADIAIAMATPSGLVTAVVPTVGTKSLQQIADEIGALAARAKAGQLDGAKMTGASFTISSLGRWGVDAFSPIISAPQVAILGVGRINRVAREGPDGSVRFASEMRLTLVFDHRANDGVEAANLLATIVSFLEHPGRIQETP